MSVLILYPHDYLLPITSGNSRLFLRRRKKNAMRMAPPSDFYFPRLWDLNLRKEWEVIRGLDGRGDRANGFFGIDPVDSNLSFNNFIVAFEGLIGSANLPTA